MEEREAVVDRTVEVLDGRGVERRAVDLYDDILSVLLLLLHYVDAYGQSDGELNLIAK